MNPTRRGRGRVSPRCCWASAGRAVSASAARRARRSAAWASAASAASRSTAKPVCSRASRRVATACASGRAHDREHRDRHRRRRAGRHRRGTGRIASRRPRRADHAMPRAGGRVWANGSGGLSSIDALAATGITHRAGTRVVAATHRELLLEDANDAATLRFERLILATGAREIQLPFPGWTLPGVVAAGGLQLMVKSGLRLDGRRVVVAGSGPLLLAAAASARQAGAQVLCVAEQAPRSRLARFALRLARYPDRALQALQLRMALAHTPYRAGWRVVEA